MFTQVIIRKRKTEDGRTDDQRETIIPSHYCVTGYNEQKYEKHQNFDLKIFIFLVVKFSIYLNRRVFVMVCVEVLRPSQSHGFMSSAVNLPNRTFTRHV